MNVRAKVIVTEVYKSDKGYAYYTAVDLDHGGEVRWSVNGDLNGVKEGDLLNVNANFKGRSYNGKFSLQYVDGSIAKPA